MRQIRPKKRRKKGKLRKKFNKKWSKMRKMRLNKILQLKYIHKLINQKSKMKLTTKLQIKRN